MALSKRVKHSDLSKTLRGPLVFLMGKIHDPVPIQTFWPFSQITPKTHYRKTHEAVISKQLRLKDSK